MGKRILSVAIAFVMIVTAIPTAVVKADTTDVLSITRRTEIAQCHACCVEKSWIITTITDGDEITECRAAKRDSRGNLLTIPCRYSQRVGEPVVKIRIHDRSYCLNGRCRTCELNNTPGAIVACFRTRARDRVSMNDTELARLVEDGTIPANVTHLSLHNGRLTDISPLASLTDLVWLDLEGNNLTDLTPLAGLTKLERLDLDYNYALADISPLSSLVNMVELDINRTLIADLSPLANMKRLDDLDLRWNPNITDISPLAGLTSLRVLELETTGVADISPLVSLTSLRVLQLSGGWNISEMRGMPLPVTDFTPLSALTDLEELQLRGNDIEDISMLAGLTSLQILDLHSNKISDITPLSGMVNLQDLRLSYNQITDVTPLFELSNLNELWIAFNPITGEWHSESLPADSVRQLRGLFDALPDTTSIWFGFGNASGEDCLEHWRDCECGA
jgi:Leucine-rich repeat (LRR) protein